MANYFLEKQLEAIAVETGTSVRSLRNKIREAAWLR
jgi:tmRNA-binding protein